MTTIRVTSDVFPYSAPRGTIHRVVRVDWVNTPPVPYYIVRAPRYGEVGFYARECEILPERAQ